jgi:hypothetical protein
MTVPKADDDSTWGVLRLGGITPEVLDSGVDLAAALREVNERTGVAACWSITTGEFTEWGPVAALTFAIDKSEGALAWQEDHDAYRPASGAGDEEREYWMPGDMNTLWLEPHTVVPVETVYAAVAEYQRTRQRPRCVAWVRTAD